MFGEMLYISMFTKMYYQLHKTYFENLKTGNSYYFNVYFFYPSEINSDLVGFDGPIPTPIAGKFWKFQEINIIRN